MKVLHIVSGDLWAGAEKQLLVLAKELIETDDVTVEVVILNAGTLATELKRLGVKVHLFEESKISFVGLLKLAREVVLTYTPDVVHSHRTKENMLAAAVTFGQTVKLIRTQHGDSEFSISLFDLRRQFLKLAGRLIDRFCFDHIVAVSQPLQDKLLCEMPPSVASRLGLIHNGIPIEKDIVTLNDMDDTEHAVKRIGIVGRLVSVKRADVFIAMAKLLSDGAGQQRYIFQIIGDGPKRAELEGIAESLGVRSLIEFTGHVNPAEPFIAQLDVLIISSDHEGLPMAALEAMSLGTLVVSHAVGGLVDLLQGGGGVLIESQDPRLYADAIKQLNNGVYRSHITRAFQKLQEHYSSSAMASKYLSVYRN